MIKLFHAMDVCQVQGNLTSSYRSISAIIKELQLKLVPASFFLSWPVPDILLWRKEQL